MRSPKSLIVIILLAMAAFAWQRLAPHQAPEAAPPAAVQPHRTSPNDDPRAATNIPALPAFLPTEAAETVGRIVRGGPFPYRQDGVIFENREGRLPMQPRGYYHEYTVETPGLDYRGARRIITGGNPPVEYYYTDDHYRTFRPFQVSP
ncbi:MULTISPECIES: ribonuclease domain-containing protein [Dyella]|uniref:Ribonuclease n=2 Tax=Dyella TaxID=231454 RepID=A0A4R0YVN2_9GAMM|nr:MULTISPECIES: ribonuclease domain-containing protein [Dyella]TBR38926.1 ribonuclease [Dyella terrae]TCI13483.1 ribonuclease [Dyella soli]